jgi:hypothetical protein
MLGFSFQGRKKEILISLLVGLLFSLSITARGLQLFSRPVLAAAAILFGLTLIFALGAYFLIRRKAVGEFLAWPWKRKGLWAAGSILTVAFLFIVIPYSLLPVESGHTLKIILPEAQNGVEVQAIRLPDGTTVDLAQNVTLTGAWNSHEGSLSTTQPGAALEYSAVFQGWLTVVFAANPAGGTVDLFWDGKREVVNLRTDGTGSIDAVLKEPTAREVLISRLVFGSDFLCAGLLLLFLGLWLAECDWQGSQPARLPARYIVWFALPGLVVWSFSLLVFWPGLMSFDSLSQWRQILNGQFIDANPAFHTLTEWLLTRIWLSPAIVALTQILSLSLITGYGVRVLRKAGAPLWACWATSILMAISPVNAFLTNILWKDILYSHFVLLLTIFLLEIVISRGAWLRNNGHWVGLGVAAALAALYRQNGLVSAFGGIAALFFFFRKFSRQIALSLALAVGLFVFVKGPVYGWVEVVPSNVIDIIPIHYMAAYAASDIPLSPQDAAYLNSIKDLSRHWNYDCFSINATTDVNFDWEVISQDRPKFYAVFKELVLSHPEVAIKHAICSSSLIWRIRQSPGAFTYKVGYDNIENDPGSKLFHLDLVSSSFFPKFKQDLMTFFFGYPETRLVDLIWRPALTLYLAVAAVGLVCIRRRSLKWLVLLGPLALHSAGLLIAVVAQDYRYMYPAHLVALTLWALALTPKKQAA